LILNCNFGDENGGKSIMISLFIRFVIIVTVIVSIVDIVGFYAIQKYGIQYLWQIVILMIIGTIIPIAINLVLVDIQVKKRRLFSMDVT
jgi:hypothetical protein